MIHKKTPAETQRLAAIDIGSNAIRLMLADYTPLGLRPIQKYRVPIRLGADVFSKGKISGKNLKASARAFRRFSEIIKKARVEKIRAVGTSALREAKNCEAFQELVRRKSGLKVEVIDGVEEARLIHLGVKREIHLETHSCLLIDIGGGSVELTFSDRGLLSATQSFPFGTVRTIEKMKKRNLAEKDLKLLIGDYIAPMSHFLESHSLDQKLDFAVGTGGNLEAIGRLKPILLKINSRTSLSTAEIQVMIERLTQMSFRDRVQKLEMKPDRADVILPALHVVLTAMKLAGTERLLIPYVGLKDGLLWSMVESPRG